MGLATTLSEASPAISSAFNIVSPVGPLSGRTTAAIVIWLVAWLALHLTWRGREIAFGGVYAVTLVLIALGFLLTFPLFFELFAAA